MMREPKTVPIPITWCLVFDLFFFLKLIVLNEKFRLTSTGTGNADGGGTSTNELGGGVDVTVGNRDGEWARLKNLILKILFFL